MDSDVDVVLWTEDRTTYLEDDARVREVSGTALDVEMGNGDGEDIRPALLARGRDGRGAPLMGCDQPGGRGNAPGRRRRRDCRSRPEVVLSGLLDACGRSEESEVSVGTRPGRA
jgi:hypothetical protein